MSEQFPSAQEVAPDPYQTNLSPEQEALSNGEAERAADDAAQAGAWEAAAQPGVVLTVDYDKAKVASIKEDAQSGLGVDSTIPLLVQKNSPPATWGRHYL